MGCLTIFALIVGTIVFLVTVHPVLFFLLILPLTIIALIAFIKWLKK